MDKRVVATGVRDLLPLDVVQKRWIEQNLQTAFQQWGYQCVITPTLETVEVLSAGGMVKPESVIQIRSGDYKAVGLRPEMTASIARAYSSRLEVETLPQRLYYLGSVFRNVPGQKETYQAGVELLGAEGLAADGEILLLVRDCLQRLELQDYDIILGDESFTYTLLQSFSHKFRAPIRKCLAELDRVGLEQLDIPSETKAQALELMELRGKPNTVFARCRALPWVANLRDKLDYLKNLVELVGDDRLVLDFSLIQDFDYYTGIVFEVVSGNLVISQGGRYDQLLGLYHPQGRSYPSVGFSWNIEALHKSLGTVLPQRTPTPDWLVVPLSEAVLPQAFVHADRLRKDTLPQRVEIYIGDPGEEAVMTYARSKEIPHIVWLQLDGTTTETNLTIAELEG
ncbi:MAG: ATP phosphoribosyltransferase regulatory subunit [Pseudanabaenaceae cyanobacterium SKYGB_i_bin29]|nr:ATP phosphoribosyltransferase regulatory subunit [Pseudanabaenaceae cyanobacterium SKYG29]MDW8421683.1 ATP phosphoribosyltransferase regulatory subunit [Pseudanabaenaceae cyanobacterium SKYGB_i_bin29]